jgi:hypothetical protein
MFDGKVVQGIDLAGDPMWGYVGSAATGLFFFLSRRFAHHMVYESYLTPDEKRIGIQVHTAFGNPGKKYEIPLGKIQFLEKDFKLEGAQKRSMFMSSSMVPLKIEGITTGNMLVDRSALHAYNYRFVDLLTKPDILIKDEKTQRTEWKKHQVNQRNHSKKK